jgi:hypothetical protein
MDTVMHWSESRSSFITTELQSISSRVTFIFAGRISEYANSLCIPAACTALVGIVMLLLINNKREDERPSGIHFLHLIRCPEMLAGSITLASMDTVCSSVVDSVSSNSPRDLISAVGWPLLVLFVTCTTEETLRGKSNKISNMLSSLIDYAMYKVCILVYETTTHHASPMYIAIGSAILLLVLVNNFPVHRIVRDTITLILVRSASNAMTSSLQAIAASDPVLVSVSVYVALHASSVFSAPQ